MERLLTRVEGIVERLQVEARAQSGSGLEACEGADSELSKFEAVRQVLTAHPFHGINRKVQIKPTGWRQVEEEEDDGDDGGEATATGQRQADASGANPLGIEEGSPQRPARRSEEIGTSPVSSPEGERPKPKRSAAGGGGGGGDGGGRGGGQPRRRATSEARVVPMTALFVLKWGGELTPLGETQATTLGAKARGSPDLPDLPPLPISQDVAHISHALLRSPMISSYPTITHDLTQSPVASHALL